MRRWLPMATALIRSGRLSGAGQSIIIQAGITGETMTTTRTMTTEATRRLDLLKELLRVQQKLVAANREHAFLLNRVATLENVLRTSSQQGRVA
jgi:hypothetical protein